jgi:hypothetical protein
MIYQYTSPNGIKGPLVKLDDHPVIIGTNKELDSIVEKGRAAWSWLHTEAAAGRLTEERLLKEFTPMIPQFGCQCMNDWRAILANNAFRPNDQFAWSCCVHNAVSIRLKPPKPMLTLEEATKLWSQS